MAESAITVNIPAGESKSYPIIINDESIQSLKQKLDDITKGKKRLIVISEKVYKLYKTELNFDKKELFVLKDGEDKKTLKMFEKIIKKAIVLKLSRKDIIIAIGGGVAGDMAGYAAASYMRGIDFIQVPTTLLACVDSSVGGKTAIDMPNGKNFVGAFYQPKMVFINLNFLKTLDEKQYKSGFGEVIKYAFIEKSCNHSEDFNLIEILKSNTENYKNRNNEFLKEIIKICLEIKSAVVNQDEKESGLRKFLNLGHTFGHALEEETHYKRYTHGCSVILGIMFVFNFALKKEFCSKQYYDEAFTLMNMYDYDTDNFLFINKKHVLKLMKNDKKADNNVITLILPTKSGEVIEYKLEDFSKLEFSVLYKN
ncbi:MAG: 3-dehydroquinate synthase [Candidatus Gastranaerophilales bacterium]|nr:3-dehydroquinate synthase [Candidatus Gastranaerophilales bacterium]